MSGFGVGSVSIMVAMVAAMLLGAERAAAVVRAVFGPLAPIAARVQAGVAPEDPTFWSAAASGAAVGIIAAALVILWRSR